MKERQFGQLTFDFIAYHVQDMDEPPLTLESLVNDKPLFFSFDREDWLPTHLDLKKYRIYTIFFTVDGYVTLKAKNKHFESTYYDLFRVKSNPKTDKVITTVTDACTYTYKKLGTQFFYLKGMNDMDEGLLYRAKDCVTEIIPYVAVENKEGITFQIDEESLTGVVPDIVKEIKIEKTKTEEPLITDKFTLKDAIKMAGEVSHVN